MDILKIAFGVDIVFLLLYHKPAFKQNDFLMLLNVAQCTLEQCYPFTVTYFSLL